MKKLLQKHAYAVLLPVLALTFSTVLFSLAKLLIAARPHVNMSLPQDALIPFLPWTVSIYLGSFFYWYISFVLACRQERAMADRVFSAHFLTVVFSFLIFLLIPTAMQRPEPDGGGFWNWAMRVVYWVDTPENLFPSLHCSTGWLCWLAVRRRKDLPVWLKLLALLLSVGVCVSTLTTKQHVLVDVVSGIALCEIDYLLASIPRVRAFLFRPINALLRRMTAGADGN